LLGKLASSSNADANYSYILSRDLHPNCNIRRLHPQADSAAIVISQPGAGRGLNCLWPVRAGKIVSAVEIVMMRE
jgi:hypothetical protein